MDEAGESEEESEGLENKENNSRFDNRRRDEEEPAHVTVEMFKAFQACQEEQGRMLKQCFTLIASFGRGSVERTNTAVRDPPTSAVSAVVVVKSAPSSEELRLSKLANFNLWKDAPPEKINERLMDDSHIETCATDKFPALLTVRHVLNNVSLLNETLTFIISAEKLLPMHRTIGTITWTLPVRIINCLFGYSLSSQPTRQIRNETERTTEMLGN
jgi:hypothetical protein